MQLTPHPAPGPPPRPRAPAALSDAAQGDAALNFRAALGRRRHETPAGGSSLRDNGPTAGWRSRDGLTAKSEAICPPPPAPRRAPCREVAGHRRPCGRGAGRGPSPPAPAPRGDPPRQARAGGHTEAPPGAPHLGRPARPPAPRGRPSRRTLGLAVRAILVVLLPQQLGQDGLVLLVLLLRFLPAGAGGHGGAGAERARHRWGRDRTGRDAPLRPWRSHGNRLPRAPTSSTGTTCGRRHIRPLVHSPRARVHTPTPATAALRQE